MNLLLHYTTHTLGFLTLAVSVAAVAQETNSDPTLAAAGPSRDPLRWLSPTNREVEINGLPWFKENGSDLVRLPARLKATFRPPVWSLARSPSGARGPPSRAAPAGRSGPP